MSQTLALIVFVGLGLAGLFGWLAVSSERAARKAELSRRLGPKAFAPDLLQDREIDALGRRMGATGRWLHQLSMQAGRPGSVAELVVFALLLTIGGVAGLAMVLDGAAIGFGALLGLLPVALLQRAARRRGRRITEQLPDALDLVARALRAGHAVPDALRVAASEMPAPLGVELVHTVEEHRLGVDLRETLRGLVDRVPESFELRLWVGAMLLNGETGGNLIEVLEHLSDTVRERVVFEGKVAALTAEVRASATILAALPFLSAVTLSLIEPDYLSPLVRTTNGQALLFGALVSVTVGLAAMRQLSHVEM